MTDSVKSDQLLALWRAEMDPSYTDALIALAGGRGYDVIVALAKLFARDSLAVERSTQALYGLPHSTQSLPPASGNVNGRGSIEITRPGAEGFPVQLEAGDRIVVSFKGTQGEPLLYPVLVLDASQSLPGADPGPYVVPVFSERPGWQGDVPAGRHAVFVERGTAAVEVGVSGNVLTDVGNPEGDRILSSMLGQFVRFTGGPNATAYPRRVVGVTSTTMTVDGPALLPSTSEIALVFETEDLGLAMVVKHVVEGGRNAELELLAKDRGLYRAEGETDEAFRQRISNLLDTVSPNAIIRVVGALLSPLGIPFHFVELRQPGAGLFFTRDSFDDPHAFEHARVFGTTQGVAAFTGFLVVVDGAAFGAYTPDEQAGIMRSLIRAVDVARAGGVPWAIAFEPPIP